MSNTLSSPAELADLYPYGEPDPYAVSDARTVFAAVSDLAFEGQDLMTAELVMPTGLMAETLDAVRYRLERAQIGSVCAPIRPDEQVFIMHSSVYDGREELPTGAYAPIVVDQNGEVTDGQLAELTRQGEEMEALSAYLDHQRAIETHADPLTLTTRQAALVSEALVKAYRRTDDQAEQTALTLAAMNIGYTEVLDAFWVSEQRRRAERFLSNGFTLVAGRLGNLAAAVAPNSRMF